MKLYKRETQISETRQRHDIRNSYTEAVNNEKDQLPSPEYIISVWQISFFSSSELLSI